MNAELQRIARRDMKAFLSDQCKEIEKNRMGKTRDLFKKIRDTKGTLHAKMGLIKDRNGMDLTEAELLRKGGKNTQKNHTRDLHDPDNYDGLVTYLEPDILEYKVKWTIGTITTNKASRGDGISVVLFQILKDDAVKMLDSYTSKFGKLSSGHRTGKGQFSFQFQRKAMPKNIQITVQLHSFHMRARLCLKSYKLGFNSMRTQYLHMYKLNLEKAKEPEIKLPTYCGSYKKQGN